jgi:hypothetical protein
MRSALGLAAAGMMIVALSTPLRGDAQENAILAKKLSGVWAFNQDLSPAFDQTRRAGRGRAGGGSLFQAGSAIPTQPRYPPGVRANPTNTEPTDAAFADMTPTERAEWTAVHQLGLVLPMLTVEATIARVTFTDERGDAGCPINGKTEKVRMFGAWLEVKCRWDKKVLRQEYATSRTKLTRTWTVDEREMLVLKKKLEGINLNSPEAAAYFDRVR